MYVKLLNGEPNEFPYSLGKLRKENPGTSFPETLSASTLASFDVYEVTPTPAPEYDGRTYTAKTSVAKVNGAWLQTWDVQQLSFDRASANVRGRRNQLLTDCDWTQLADSPVEAGTKPAWVQYRKDLRDISQQPGFPWDVQWPSEPA